MLNNETAQVSLSLRLLKPGIDAPALFIAPGLSGSMIELLDVVDLIRTYHPIYGLEWTCSDGPNAPDTTVEIIGLNYMEAILKLQPRGPYALAGYSFGGLPMLETARLLTESGEKVALLAFLDAFPHERYWSLMSWMGVLGRRAKHHLSTLIKMPPNKAISHINDLYSKLIDHLRARRGESPRNRSSSSYADALMAAKVQNLDRRVEKSHAVACAQYRPRYYAGKLTLLKAADEPHFPSDVTRLWGQFVQELEVHDVPGDHRGSISANANDVAAKLSLCLEKSTQFKLT
jgi:acetoacetyl-CoA synthetase